MQRAGETKEDLGRGMNPTENSSHHVEGSPNGDGTSKKTESTTAKQPTAASSAVANRKESFQWSTPADEFADDVGSDIEDDEDDIEDDDLVTLKAAQPQIKKKRPKVKQTFPCPKCSKVWNWPWELRRHLLMHFKEKERMAATAYKCKECSKGFLWKRDLAQHMRFHTGEKLLVCSVCGKKFVTRQALLHHVVVHTGEKPFQCALCGNRFTQPANLRTHTKKKHDSGPIKGSKCPHCSESFNSVVAIHQHILEDHQNIVAEDREELAFVKIKRRQEKEEKERKKEENRRRREERRTERTMLGGDYRDPNMPEWKVNYEFNLGEGMVRGVDWDRTPSNGDLGCEECDRTFGWRYEIMFHRLCHATDVEGNPKNRVCPECDTVFKVPIGLKHHLLLHTGELPFLCLHCWRSFSSHIDLKLHIRREHLFHLELPQPNKLLANKRKVKNEADGKKVKGGRGGGGDNGDNRVVHVLNEAGERVQLVVQQEHQQQQQQAILVGADGTLVNPNNQDMIVVIQSEEYDQSQGVVVVDPDQLRGLVGTNGVAQPSGEEEAQYIGVELSDADGSQQQQQQHVVLSTDARGQQTANINGNDYVVVAADDIYDQATPHGASPAGNGGHSVIVHEMMTSSDLGTGENGNRQILRTLPSEPVPPPPPRESTLSTVDSKSNISTTATPGDESKPAAAAAEDSKEASN